MQEVAMEPRLSSRMMSWRGSVAAANTSSSATPITKFNPNMMSTTSQRLRKIEEITSRAERRVRQICVRKCKPNAARMKLHQPQYFPPVQPPRSQCNQPQEADDERRTLDQKLAVFRLDGPRKSALFILTYLATRNQYLVVQVRKVQGMKNSMCVARTYGQIFARFPCSASLVEIK